MVAGQNRDVSMIFGVLIPLQILVKETGYAAACIFLEITVIFRIPVSMNAAAVVVIIAHQRGVTTATLIEHEVHIVSAAQ